MKKTIYILFLMCSLNADAVFVNNKGLGEALIIPYYTVNNDLNTLVSITNTQDNAKAIKINFREGLNGHAALSYNVYLDAFDTWSFVLASINSNQVGYENQPSAAHFTSDLSCSPYLSKNRQEFLPFGLTTGPQGLTRVREGYIEILEMGEIPMDSDFFTALDLGTNGVPADCSLIEQAWEEGGTWSGDSQRDIEPPSGGLMATADLINVAEGINYSIPVTALADFFPDDEIFHVNPGDTELSLDAAKPNARVVGVDKHHNLQFNTGIDAVSGVLMADQVLSTYVLDSFVAGKTEIVYTQPTRRFYLDVPFSSTEAVSPPFNLNFKDVPNCESGVVPSGFYGGIQIDGLIFDREAQKEQPSGGVITRPPDPPKDGICGSVFVHSIKQPEADPSLPGITGSENIKRINTMSVPHATENGFLIFDFLESRPIRGTDADGDSYNVHGIPVLGLTLFRFTNGGAGEGLLAQYGGSYPLMYKTRVEEN